MVKETIKVSMLQMSSKIGDVDANCVKIEELVNSGLSSDVDVLILPEVWTVGWDCEKFLQSAQDLSSSSVINFLSSIAKKHNINIIGGSFISKQGDKYYNTCPVIDRSGKLVTVYNKMHLYSYYGCDESKYVNVGDSPVMVSLDGVNFGLTVCYDIRFPEIYRAYRKAGADVLVNCAAWGSTKPIPWEVMTKSRAVENQCYMIALTQSGKIKDNEYNLGESRIIDYKGEELNSIMSGEGISSAVLNMNEMYDFRQKCAILNDIRDDYEVKVLCVK